MTMEELFRWLAACEARGVTGMEFMTAYVIGRKLMNGEEVSLMNIEKTTHINRRTMQRAIRTLEHCKLIEVGPRHSNRLRSYTPIIPSGPYTQPSVLYHDGRLHGVKPERDFERAA